MEFIRKSSVKFLFLVVILSSGWCNVKPPIVNQALLSQSMTLGECQACKLFVKEFTKGLERTARGKYEGGDAAWEEEKLKKSYKRSEMRLIDIQDGICRGEPKHEVQCQLMAEKAEEFIEEWWAQDPDESVDLYGYICIEKMRLCCPPYHYGKDCLPCPGDHGNLCNGNGKCRGDGTRKGNGTCLCDEEYTGENCDQCNIGFYESYKDATKLLCSPCHKSCMSGCWQSTQKDCVVCKPGYQFDTDEGCLDVNECDKALTCEKDEFCLNSIGSYACVNCDKSCEGCHGDGPDMCQKCAKGYSKKGEFCIIDTVEEGISEMMANTRKEEL